jgi:hypothetical protein
MRVFPQLVTGAMAQFQVSKQIEGRAVLNRAADASTYAAADADARRVRWSLGFTGLSSAEFAALQGLFADSEGRLGAFTFLDPTANLLGWTEDFAAPAWQKDATIAVVAGLLGPMGDGFELVNSGQNWAEVWQTLAAPASFVYAFSVWVRGSGTVRLRRFGGAASEELEFALTGGWKRVELNGALGAIGDGVSFAIGVPAGGQVDVAGPMVEAQLVASEYKKSVGRGGVYPQARFATDSLPSVVEAMDWIDARVSIESRFED